jgi:hypothetical protein
MTQAVGSSAKLERWLALVVRYWAFNMTLIHDRDSNWPGFGYSDAEKTTLRSIAGKVPGVEYWVWLALVVVLILATITGITIAGMNILSSAIGAERNMVWFQITRIAMVLSVALLGLWLFVPSDSKFWVISELIVPLLSPAVAALSAAYYFSFDCGEAPQHPKRTRYSHYPYTLNCEICIFLVIK